MRRLSTLEPTTAPATESDRRSIVVTSVSSDSHTWNLVSLQLLFEELGPRMSNLGACPPDAAAGACVSVDTAVYAEASTLVDIVLDFGPDLGRALAEAFRRGYVDVSDCLHPDNAGSARSHLDESRRLWWCRSGSMPLPDGARTFREADLSAAGLLALLSHVQRKFDHATEESDDRPTR
jgi:hypothetical protein